MATIEGTSGSDRLQGGAGYDTIFGLAGRDAIYGAKGSDDLYGGRGDDRLSGGPDSDSAFWRIGEGNDVFNGGSGSSDVDSPINFDFDTFYFDTNQSNGRVTLTALGGGDSVQAYAVTDANGTETLTLRDVESIDIVTGDGADFIDLRGIDRPLPPSGNPGLLNRNGIATGGGDDKVIGSSYRDLVADGAGDDVYRLNGGRDFYQDFAGSGSDQLFLGGGRDEANFYVSSVGRGHDLTILDFNDDEDRLSVQVISDPSRDVLNTNHDGFFGRGDAGVTIKNGDLVFDAGSLVTGSDHRELIVLNDVTKIDADAIGLFATGGPGE